MNFGRVDMRVNLGRCPGCGCQNGPGVGTLYCDGCGRHFTRYGLVSGEDDPILAKRIVPYLLGAFVVVIIAGAWVLS